MTGARTAVLTVSDGVTHGTRADESGDLAQSLLADAGYDVVTREVVPDERAVIEETLVRLAGAHALIVTTGGTGFGPRDVTPEATKAVLDREAPGLAELMRTAGLAHTPMAALSRATAGTIGDAVVVNLPGSPKGVRESLEAVATRPAACRRPPGWRDRRTSDRHDPCAACVATTSSMCAPSRWSPAHRRAGSACGCRSSPPGRPTARSAAPSSTSRPWRRRRRSGGRGSRAPGCCTTTMATSRSSSSHIARRLA